MDEIYDRIYHDMFNNVTVPSTGPNFPPPLGEQNYLKEIKEIIRQEEIAHTMGLISPVKLRPDARYFLLLGLYHMSAFPVKEKMRRLPEAGGAKLSLNDIRHAASVLIKTAVNKHTDPIDHEISSHEILKAADQNWNELKVTMDGFWAKSS